MFDIVVIGGGPAGWALADACVQEGMRTALVDSDPQRIWRATYAAWYDELPRWSIPAIAAAPRHTRAAAVTEHTLDRSYAILDNTQLSRLLHNPAVVPITGTVRSLEQAPHGLDLRLDDSSHLSARLAIDATGAPPSRTGYAEQTAAGVVVSGAEARRLIPDPLNSAVFMDWRGAARRDTIAASFLYAVPIGGDDVLLEETSLAARPPVGHDYLARRLAARLREFGLDPSGYASERVRIPLDVPAYPAAAGRRRAGARGRARWQSPLRFGAAAAMVHPATGYQVATALDLAPRVAAALAATLPRGPNAAARAARHEIFSPRAVAVHALRRQGLRALLRMPSGEIPTFFELFFRLPNELQRAYLSGREDLGGTAAAMRELFAAAPWRLRRQLAR